MLFIVLFTIFIVYTHMGMPYDYVIPIWVYLCQQQNMYKYSYIIKSTGKYWIY